MIEASARGDTLSAGTVARHLGIAPTTLRTWHQRYGLGPSSHEAGRHRRYTPHDVAALTVMTRLTTHGVPAAEAARMARRQTTPCAAEHPITDQATASAARGLARAAQRLDVLALRDTLTAAVAAHGVVHTYHTLAGPAFTLISQSRSPLARKDAARRVLGRCLNEVFAAVPRPPAGQPVRTLLVAADARRDVAALDALAAALAEAGIGSVHLGAGLDRDTLTDVVDRGHPAAVVLWSHAQHSAMPVLLSALTDGARWRPAIVTGGHGWGDQSTAATLADAVAAVTGLVAA
ncbi:MerR family transcriptional regulator [Actinoplanes sp. TFC3]|uniref:MerR family transcriptional regulator n=1 Tax=Actinoplanes sp. TFC3 TaxID=1710355 RepID=UPI000835D6C8|nr:MerR family transcriptional regulator [Actinoplanes sp. TFC3]